MSPTVPVMMWGWIPLTLKFFERLPHHRATIVSLILAWMFLPEYAYRFPGLPDYSKAAAAAISVLIATFAFGGSALSRFRFGLHDALMLTWCLTPLFASIDNGLGLYDGVSATKNYVTTWYGPYFVGRLYIRDWNSFRELAWAIFFGGLIYAPLCAYEIVMSPQLHNKIYGWHPHDFIQSVRGNSFRPVVFMHHGLMVGMWMMAASLIGVILWRSGQLKEIAPLIERLHLKKLSPRLLIIGLLIVFIASKSMGATVMLGQAWLIYELSTKFRTGLLIVLLALSTPYSIYQKIRGEDNGRKTVEFIRKFNEERAASLEYRLINEEMLVEKAMERPVFGWGGWGRSRIYDQDGKDVVVTDAYWIIILGTTGLVGVSLFCLITLVPPLRFVLKIPRKAWRDPRILLAFPVLIQLPLYASDCLLNDMGNPIYMVIAGGLISLTQSDVWLKMPKEEEVFQNKKSRTMNIPLCIRTHYI
jgi:hypothetical protein